MVGGTTTLPAFTSTAFGYNDFFASRIRTRALVPTGRAQAAATLTSLSLDSATAKYTASPRGLAIITSPSPIGEEPWTVGKERQDDSGFESNERTVGLTEEIVRCISKRGKEPEWMLQFRLEAYRQWLTMEEPAGEIHKKRPSVDFHDMCSYDGNQNRGTERLGDLAELTGGERDLTVNLSVGVSDSFASTHKEALAEAGVIFCSISEAVHEHPELLRKYLGKVVPATENYYAALNSAIFVDGSFCYVPKNTVCPMDISTHFLENGRKMTNQFERILIVCDENSFVSSLGCTSPSPLGSASLQLHAPVIELCCAAGAEIKYLIVQNWHELGDHEQAVYNYVTQRGLCDGSNSKITWTTVETGSAVTWQHPTVILKGDSSVADSFSITLTNTGQQADIGANMIHIGSNTQSRIVAKIISAGKSQSCFRSHVHVNSLSEKARNQTQRDTILIGDHAETTSHPSVVVKNPSAQIEETGDTMRLKKEQVFYFQQRGIATEKAVATILTGFCDVVLRELPHEFASEVTEMVAMKIEEAMESSAS